MSIKKKDNFKYKIKTEKLICTTTTTHNAEKYKVGDYVYLGLNLYIHNSIDIRYGVTVVTGLAIVYPYTPEKKDEYANIPDIKVLKDTSAWFKLEVFVILQFQNTYQDCIIRLLGGCF